MRMPRACTTSARVSPGAKTPTESTKACHENPRTEPRQAVVRLLPQLLARRGPRASRLCTTARAQAGRTRSCCMCQLGIGWQTCNRTRRHARRGGSRSCCGLRDLCGIRTPARPTCSSARGTPPWRSLLRCGAAQRRGSRRRCARPKSCRPVRPTATARAVPSAPRSRLRPETPSPMRPLSNRSVSAPPPTEARCARRSRAASG
mmetsp:Transcript_34316/g.94598  ORF Transcript_34316/g.94598 Transcript_34316/m.94598 type:complete len:204 (-) Transcript_34316:383-994(-)